MIKNDRHIQLASKSLCTYKTTAISGSLKMKLENEPNT